MGNTISCSITGVSFASDEKYKDVKRHLIRAVVKEQHSYHMDFDFTAYEVKCAITDRGLLYYGSIRYGNCSGRFTIEKVNLLQRFCKC